MKSFQVRRKERRAQRVNIDTYDLVYLLQRLQVDHARVQIVNGVLDLAEIHAQALLQYTDRLGPLRVEDLGRLHLRRPRGLVRSFHRFSWRGYLTREKAGELFHVQVFLFLQLRPQRDLRANDEQTVDK